MNKPWREKRRQEGNNLAFTAINTIIFVFFIFFVSLKLVRINLLANDVFLHNDEILVQFIQSPAAGVRNQEPIFRSAIVPTDTNFNNQWYLKKIRAPQAWDLKNSSPSIIIAIIDSGVDIDHPDLKDNIWLNKDELPGNGIDDDKNGFIDDTNGWDFVANVPDPNPKFEKGFTLDGVAHGTIVSGIAAAIGNNATGVSGVSWQAQIMPLAALNGAGEAKANNVVRAIDYAVANGADIINLSFNGPVSSQGVNEAIRRAYEAGVIVVAAAGNETDKREGYSLDKTPMYPVCSDGPVDQNWVIGVAATDTLDQKAGFSSYGFRCIDISAPGISVYSTMVYSPSHFDGKLPLDKYYDGYWSGTSVAAPIISGSLALIEAANPTLTRKQVVDVLLNSADGINRLNPDYLNQLGKGRLNLESSLNNAIYYLDQFSVDLAVAPARGRGSMIKVSDLNGSEKRRFEPYGSFRGGVNLAAGDIDGNGKAEIITAAGAGGGPHIKIFDAAGKLLGQFMAYDKNFRGGVNLAAGDIDGNGKAEIITAAGKGGKPEIKIFDSANRLLRSFMAYDKNFRGGVNLAAGDIDGRIANRKDEIITIPAANGGPHLKIFDSSGRLRAQFMTFDKNFRGGASVAAGDFNKDGKAELIAGAGTGGSPHVRVFDQRGRIIGSFYGFEGDFTGGVNLTTLKNYPK